MKKKGIRQWTTYIGVGIGRFGGVGEHAAIRCAGVARRDALLVRTVELEATLVSDRAGSHARVQIVGICDHRGVVPQVAVQRRGTGLGLIGHDEAFLGNVIDADVWPVSVH